MPGLAQTPHPAIPLSGVGRRSRRSAAVGALALLTAGLGAIVPLSPAGGATAAAPAPAAAPGAGTPGAAPTDVRYGQRSMDGGNWSGAVVPWGSFSSVHANWVEPRVSCTHRNDLMAPWVGIDGWGSSTVQQVGVETNCSGGTPHYRGWYEMYPAPPVYFGNPVQAGDLMWAVVSRSGTHYTLSLTDQTRHWTRTITRTSTAHHVSAEVILESPSNAFPRYSSLTFGSAAMNHRSPASFSVYRLNASSRHGTQNHTSPISGGHFTISYVRE